jgi:hypothetical protein
MSILKLFVLLKMVCWFAGALVCVGADVVYRCIHEWPRHFNVLKN